MATNEERFWAKVNKTDGCWLWTASAWRGYGIFWADGRRWKAPRYSWALVNGPIPSGLMVCHRCDNPPCVRPSHLFIGTMSDNIRDAYAKGRHSAKPMQEGWSRAARARTHCKHGHEFTSANTIDKPHGRRACRTCMNRLHREYRARLKQKAAQP